MEKKQSSGILSSYIFQLSGATYMDIYEMGGGIHFSVQHTRRATEDELYQLLKDRFQRMLFNGI